MARMIHSMIRVADENRSLDFYRRALGLEIAQRVDFDDFSLIYLSNAETGFELELTVNHGPPASYDLGDGYGHLAVSVDDLAGEHDRLVAEGFAPEELKELTHGDFRARYFFISDPDGYRIEVLERGGRFL